MLRPLFACITTVAVLSACTSAPPPAATKPRAAKPAPAGFEQVLELQGVSFHVSSPNAASANPLRIVPSGLTIDNTPISREVEGTVTGAEVADLNADGSPELYVYVRSADEAARGSVVAYGANKGKSLSEIHLPPLPEEVTQGYRGHDEFAVLENRLGRRFPIHQDDSESAGKMRQLQYELVAGEASWLLELDRSAEF